MDVEWSSSGHILYEIIFSFWQVKERYILLPGNFYGKAQSAWESAHWQAIVKEIIDA